MIARESRTPLLSSPVRRRLVHGGLIGAAVLYVGTLVMAPLVGITVSAVSAGGDSWRATLTDPDALHAYLLTGVIALITVAVTGIFGVIVSAIVDLPFAVSPIIVGLMAVLLFGRGGWFEPWFAARGIQILYAVPSMVLVTVFISIPFVIREVAPVLEELGTQEEEASKTLGASGWTTFLRVTLPSIRWGLLYGMALSAARSMGEVGAVLVVSGTIAGRTETAPLYILRQFDQSRDAAAYIVALSLAVASIALLTGIEILKASYERRRSA